MPSGEEMSQQDWQTGFAKSVGVFLNGKAIPTPNARGEKIVDDDFYVLFNAHWGPVEFIVPRKWGSRWEKVIDTACSSASRQVFSSGEPVVLTDRSVVVLRHLDGPAVR
jgi:glycogen operon protein